MSDEAKKRSRAFRIVASPILSGIAIGVGLAALYAPYWRVSLECVGLGLLFGFVAEIVKCYGHSRR
jgi:hypothetical protein